MANQAGRMVLVNAQAEKLFGYPRSELLGQGVEVLVPERFRRQHPAYRDRFFAAPECRAMGAGRELFGRRKDGSEFPVEIGLTPVQTEEGLVVISEIVDITERKQAEAEVRRLNVDLQRRVRELSELNGENETFVYSASHDLRSPLVNLQGFSAELEAACDEIAKTLATEEVPAAVRQRVELAIATEVKEPIQFIRASVTRLGGIIDALLRLSRAGRVEYEERDIDLNKIVERIVNSMRGTLAERGAKVNVRPLPIVRGDATAVEQLFANLIGNALNYLDPARAGEITVGALPESQVSRPNDGRECTCFVRDNGLGIPAVGQSKVFQAFQRLHPDVAAGEGMGLSIVRRVAERHGGRVWLESTENVGSTFFVALPLAANGAPAAVKTAVAAHPSLPFVTPGLHAMEETPYAP